MDVSESQSEFQLTLCIAHSSTLNNQKWSDWLFGDVVEEGICRLSFVCRENKRGWYWRVSSESQVARAWQLAGYYGILES